jgi:hypothetical protein
MADQPFVDFGMGIDLGSGPKKYELSDVHDEPEPAVPDTIGSEGGGTKLPHVLR